MLMISGNWWNPIVTSSDTEAPTQPGTAVSSELTYDSVRLTWAASTDNEGVTAYRIYDNNALIDSVSGSLTSVTLSGLTPETDYSFTVKAFDLAGNSSTASGICLVTTPPYSGQIYEVTASAGGNGSITPSGTNAVILNGSIVFTLNPDNGYKVGQLLLDGNPVSETHIINNTYTLSDISENHSVSVTFIEMANNTLSVDYVIQSDWSGNSFHATVTIRNTGSEIVNGWKITWTYPTQQVSSFWSSNMSQSGTTVTITPASWNGTIPAGGSVSFGLLGSYSGINGNPENIIIE